MVMADAQRLNQLLTNLLTNTLQYTDAPGQARLELRTEGEVAIITLDDSAPGCRVKIMSVCSSDFTGRKNHAAATAEAPGWV